MSALKSLSLAHIAELQPQALDDLEFAATKQGFFHLDINFSPQLTSSNVSIDECFKIAARLYDLPHHEKLSYDIDKLGSHKLNGYKPAGRNAGVNSGKQDGFEAYLVPRDGVAALHPGEAEAILPSILQDNKELIQRVMDELHSAGLSVLRALSIVLADKDLYDLAKRHRPQHQSTSALGLLKYSPVTDDSNMIGHSAHTDVGSLTLLFCTGPGLQFLDPISNQWADVEVRPRHAIVNIGDSLRFLAEGKFKSCLHRVVPAPSTQKEDRYSVAYFMRPETSATFNDDNGKQWTSLDWHDNKYRVFRAPLEQQKSDEDSLVLTGKAGYLGLWET